MTEIVGAIMGALAVISIPLVTWFSRRATREGRLLIRVERLGLVYALMPASPDKDTFEGHLTSAIAELNSWLNADNAKRRKLIRNIKGWTYCIGVVAVLIVLPSIDAAANPWQSSLLGTVIGVAIVAVPMGASFLLERSARSQSARVANEREEAAAAIRLEALRQGEPAPVTQPVVRSRG